MHFMPEPTGVCMFYHANPEQFCSNKVGECFILMIFPLKFVICLIFMQYEVISPGTCNLCTQAPNVGSFGLGLGLGLGLLRLGVFVSHSNIDIDINIIPHRERSMYAMAAAA